MADTQLELLIEVNRVYCEIRELTEQLLHVDPHEQLELIKKRGALISQCQTSLENLNSLPEGDNVQRLVEEKQVLHDAIVSTVSQDSLIADILSKNMGQVEADLKGTVHRKRASGYYKLHSRKR